MNKPLTILLAEDNTGDVFLVRQSLFHHQIPHHLVVKSDGEEALQFLRDSIASPDSSLPDLILLDLNLPKTDGHQLLHFIRAESASSQTPVIIITSSDSAKDRTRSAELGANRYFRKPMEIDDFFELGGVIKELMRTGAHA